MMNDITRYSPQGALTTPLTYPSTPVAAPSQAQRSAVPIEMAAVEWSAEDQQALDSFDSILQVYNCEDRKSALAAAKHWYTELLRNTARTDKQDIAACIASLKRSWGSDFPKNMKRLDSLMNALPEEVAVALYEARDNDGTLLLNNDAVVSFFVMCKVALDQPRQTRTDLNEREQIEAMMRNLSSDYWRGPRAAKLQARYRELLDLGE